MLRTEPVALKRGCTNRIHSRNPFVNAGVALAVLALATTLMGCESQGVALTPPPPAIDLPDHQGKRATLSEYRGVSPVLLVFYRGYWCPFCLRQLLQLERLKASALKDVVVLAVSPDTLEETSRLLERVKTTNGVSLTHRFLSDSDLAAIDAYGIRNREYEKPIPHATTILIDREGREVWRFSDKNYERRPTDADLAEAAYMLKRESGK